MKVIKYIMQDGDTPILFPEWLTHSDVARSLGRDVISAGFCNVGGRDDYGNPLFHCYGKSVSMQLKSRGQQDSDILNRSFGIKD
jgi:hypothetical protein